jgi:hypothetical protein
MGARARAAGPRHEISLLTVGMTTLGATATAHEVTRLVPMIMHVIDGIGLPFRKLLGSEWGTFCAHSEIGNRRSMHIDRGTTGGGLRSTHTFGQASLPLCRKIFDELVERYGNILNARRNLFCKVGFREVKSGLSPHLILKICYLSKFRVSCDPRMSMFSCSPDLFSPNHRFYSVSPAARPRSDPSAVPLKITLFRSVKHTPGSMKRDVESAHLLDLLRLVP